MKNLTIEGFSPTCLMGVTGAISGYKGYTYNINRLYFRSSYIYEKKDEQIYNSAENKMQVFFSRELPLRKEEFIERLSYYYGLEYYYDRFSEFDELLDVIDNYLRIDVPLMMEIDFYFMIKHRYYQKVHDQHMMIVEGIDKKKRVLYICEAIYGHFEMSFDEYRAYFDDVIQNRNRDVYLLQVKKKTNSETKKIRKEWFYEDLEKSINNLSMKEQQGRGMCAFSDFKEDLLSIIKSRKCKNGIIIPGMWVFMCDNMNNVNFIKEFRKDYPGFGDDVVEKIRKSCIVINRKWFYITMALLELEKFKFNDLEKAFQTIEQEEEKKLEALGALKLLIDNI